MTPPERERRLDGIGYRAFIGSSIMKPRPDRARKQYRPRSSPESVD